MVVRKILESKDKSYGYDAEKETYCNLMDAGVIDPTKVARCALQNAVSIAGILLTTECIITDIPKKGDEKMPQGVGWYGWYGRHGRNGWNGWNGNVIQ